MANSSLFSIAMNQNREIREVCELPVEWNFPYARRKLNCVTKKKHFKTLN